MSDVVGQVAALARDAGTLALVVDATAAHDLGASDAQELGYSLAAGAAYLRILTDAGIALDDAAAPLEFRTPRPTSSSRPSPSCARPGGCGRACSSSARPPAASSVSTP